MVCSLVHWFWIPFAPPGKLIVTASSYDGRIRMCQRSVRHPSWIRIKDIQHRSIVVNLYKHMCCNYAANGTFDRFRHNFESNIYVKPTRSLIVFGPSLIPGAASINVPPVINSRFQHVVGWYVCGNIQCHRCLLCAFGKCVNKHVHNTRNNG